VKRNLIGGGSKRKDVLKTYTVNISWICKILRNFQ